MQKVYSLYDSKAGVYSAPFLANSDDEAKRILLDMCIYGGDNLIAKHTEDYSLVSIGEFDNHTGLLNSYNIVSFVESALNLVRSFKEAQNKKIVSDDTDTSPDNSNVVELSSFIS